ncbi:hypothetical protein FQZ97_847970 [compost metagenome]
MNWSVGITLTVPARRCSTFSAAAMEFLPSHLPCPPAMAARGTTSEAESTTPTPQDWKRRAMAGSNTEPSASMA